MYNVFKQKHTANGVIIVFGFYINSGGEISVLIRGGTVSDYASRAE